MNNDSRRVVRRLLLGSGINGLGGGVWFTVWALYLTRDLGIPPGRAGLALLVAGAVGLALAVPVGAVADRYGARRVLVVLYLVRGGAALAFLLVRDLPSLVVAAALFDGAQIVGMGVQGALVAGLFEGGERVRVLALNRAVVHATNALGAAIGAVVLTIDQHWAYATAIAFNAVTFVVAALTLRGMPEAPTVERSARWAGLRGEAVRDLPYIAVMAPVAGLTLCWAMLSAGVPLWVSERTDAPPAVAAVAVVISAVFIAVLQTPVSVRVRTVSQGARAATWAGGLLAASCLVLVGAPWLGAAVVLAAVVVHVAGELLFTAGQWQLSMELMREDRKGEYQGLNAALTGVVMTFAPALVTALVGGLAAVGWVVLALVFAACAAPVVPLARWAERTRPAEAVSVREQAAR
ncbi:MFS transporter [Actinomadura namibiensis]|uniref:MFS family permease n=1 Tax=Actinomadura namibiensis TaxID=182080 RepID=A0A7W3LYW7_ACTNM|nr:MFS transporter [Actinomadura namibiensis]MBA8956881.1 MFS family permease [Actinomadura namibiensis]